MQDWRGYWHVFRLVAPMHRVSENGKWEIIKSGFDYDGCGACSFRVQAVLKPRPLPPGELLGSGWTPCCRE